MANINVFPKNHCCGCTACYAVCPVQAITMESDEQGFKYPKIDSNKCINCGLCYKVCSNDSFVGKELLGVYAVKHCDVSVLHASSSGGITHALCQWCISAGGIVFGVAYDSDKKVVTCRAETMEQCAMFHDSKYVQTDLKDTFMEVYEELLKHRRVLYFGTSCHVAGLKSFLTAKRCSMDNLLTVDLICHGVPSPLLFGDYIKFLREDSEFSHFEFRTKDGAWGKGSSGYWCTIFKDNGARERHTHKARIFLNLFFSNNCLRPHCYECHYAQPYKPADITIGDYWGLEEAHPEFMDKNGVSAVLVQSQKGKEVLMELEGIYLLESALEKVRVKQANLFAPSPKSKTYDEFWNLYYEKGFMAIAKKYGGYSIKDRLKEKVKNGLEMMGLLSFVLRLKNGKKK